MDNEVPSNIAPLAGPLLIGYLLNWGLQGVLCVQVYTYYCAFPNDRPFVKYLVYGTLLFEIAQTITATNDAFTSFGSGFGSMDALESVHLTWLTVPVAGGLIGCTVQFFFAYRIRVLSGSYIIGSMVVVVSLCGGVAALYSGVQIARVGSLREFSQPRIRASTAIWTGSCALCDIVIAISMSYYLSQRDTGFRSTHILITRLIRVIVGTGVATATVAIAHLGLFLGLPEHNYHTITALVIAKLYSNTMLMVINDRMRIVDGRNDRVDTLGNSYIRTPPGAFSLEWAQGKNPSPPRVGINVHREVWIDSVALGPVEP